MTSVTSITGLFADVDTLYTNAANFTGLGNEAVTLTDVTVAAVDANTIAAATGGVVTATVTADLAANLISDLADADA